MRQHAENVNLLQEATVFSSFQEWANAMAWHLSSACLSVNFCANHFFSQANGQIATKLSQDGLQVSTLWYPGKPASRLCSRSRSRSKVTWYVHFLGFLEWATPSLTVWWILLKVILHARITTGIPLTYVCNVKYLVINPRCRSAKSGENISNYARAVTMWRFEYAVVLTLNFDLDLLIRVLSSRGYYSTAECSYYIIVILIH